MSQSLRALLCLVVFASIAAACSAPPVAVRRTAITPLPTGPARTGRPMEAGEIRMEFSLDQSLLEPRTNGFSTRQRYPYGYTEVDTAPHELDPGVQVPQTQLGGAIYFGLIDALEIGFFAKVGTEASMRANYPAHVIDFRSGPSYRMGPTVRGNIPVSERFVLSLVGEFSVVAAPQMTFECLNRDRLDEDPFGTPSDPNEPLTGWCTTRDEFETIALKDHALGHAAFAIEPVVLLGDMFSAHARVGVSRGIRNIGFEPDYERRDEDTLGGYATIVAGLGAEATFDWWFLSAGLDFLVPLESTVGWTPVFSVRTGPRLPGVERRRELRAR